MSSRLRLRPCCLLDRVLDRQAVAVPAGHVLRVEAGQLPRLDDHVLEHLVDGVAHVDLAVGVGRAVVQHEQRRAVARVAQLLVQALFVPVLDPARLALGQVAAHRERRVGQVQRGAVVGLGGLGSHDGRQRAGAEAAVAGRQRWQRPTDGPRGRVKFGRAWSGGRWRRASSMPCNDSTGPPAGRRTRRARRPRPGDAGAQRLQRRGLPRRAACAAVPRGRSDRSPLGAQRGRPVQAETSSSTRPASSTVGRTPRLATPGSGASARPCTRTTKMPGAAGRGWPKRRFSVGVPSSRPSLRPCTTWPLML